VSRARDHFVVEVRDEPDFDLAVDAFRRRIRIGVVEPGVVVGALEDDFHHFVVTLAHDGTRVTGVDAVAHRWPWSTCPDAATVLGELVGMPLTARFTDVATVTDPRHHCTHQLDAAAHAITSAAHGRRARRYDVEVPRAVDGVSRNRLWVDGHPALTWTVRLGEGLVDPSPPFDAAPWRGGFMRWADATLEPDAAEQAIVLRRGSDIGMGRGMVETLDSFDTAARLSPIMHSICYTMQPDRAPVAFRNRGHWRDFATRPGALLRPEEVA
jgi:hypothetical protein